MKRTTSIAVALVAVLSFWAAARMHGPLLESRRQYHLNWDEPLENSPPLVSFTTVALGGFRGIVADLLWLRAGDLQDQKKFFELVQLADWITKLEPRFALVWEFQAWNMAYNVSVMLDNPADRWRWVRQGIKLLRDEGLYYNPGDPGLYHQLGWLFFHKVGQYLDQAHLYYKQAWAEEMMALWGDKPRPDFAAMIAHPSDPRVQEMIHKYKLLPEVMQQVDKEYGPLDWRLPDAHAIYWAWRGKKFAKGFDRVQLDRLIFQSMQDAFREGSLVYNREEQIFVLEPNLALLPHVREAYEQALAAHPDEDSIKSAYRNFLESAILILYTYNRLGEAGQCYQKWCELAGQKQSEPLAQFAYTKLTEEMTSLSPPEALAYVQGLYFQSYRWLAIGEDERAAGLSQLGRLCWERYQEKHAGQEQQERVGLPALDEVRRQAWQRALASLHGAEARARLKATATPR